MSPAARTSTIPRRVHALGAGGAGVSGALRILHARGHVVSGVDRANSEGIEALNDELGVAIAIDADGRSKLPDDVELVVRSAAVPVDHPHVAAALARGVEVCKYAELLGRLTADVPTLGVSGTHGKTTTAWFLWHALRAIADTLPGVPRPSVLVGGVGCAQGSNVVLGAPEGPFVVEACEYDRSFLHLRPRAAIVTNVEADHLDYYGTLQAIEEAFARFVASAPSAGLVVCGPDVPARVVAAARASVWRFGYELTIDLLGQERGCGRFRLRGPGWASPAIQLAVPGDFNVSNAAAALALAVGHAAASAGLDPESGARAGALGIESFQGVRRRFEVWGDVGPVSVVHDYAHHPTEVRVTLEAARKRFPRRRLVVLFQPHQHGRTARFLAEFVDSLRVADHVVVGDVYGARAHIDRSKAGAPELVAELARRGITAEEGGALEPSVSCVARAACAASGAGEATALFVLGAGDVDSVRPRLLDELALRSALERRSR